MAPSLVHAEVRLWQAGHQVGDGEYHLRGKGGLALTKWQGTRTKMAPVLEALLAGVEAGAVSTVMMPPPASSESAVPAVAPTTPDAAQVPAATTPRERDPAKRCDACGRIGKGL